MPVTTRISAVFSDRAFHKIHAYARANGVDAKQVVAGVVEAWVDGAAPSEFAPKAKTHANESRVLHDIRCLFVALGTQTIADLRSVGRSDLAIRKAVAQLVANGEVIQETAPVEAHHMGRPPCIYLPIVSKLTAAIEKWEADHA